MPDDQEKTKTQEIVEAISARISSGRFAPGDRLPSIEDLAFEFGTSKHPPIEAYRILKADGVVYSEPRSGYRVTGRPRSSVEASIDDHAARIARIERHLGLTD